jgi:hypothetical protein
VIEAGAREQLKGIVVSVINA